MRRTHRRAALARAGVHGDAQDAAAGDAAGAVAADPAPLPAVAHERRAQHMARVDAVHAERHGLGGRSWRA